MEYFGSVRAVQENVEELIQKIQYVTYELEITRKITNEEIMKNDENIKKLLQLLQNTYKERDEARSKLKKLQQLLAFNNYKPLSNNNVEQVVIPRSTFHATTPFSPDSPLLSSGCGDASPSCNVLGSISSSDTSYVCFSGPASPIVRRRNDNNEATLTIESLAKGRPRPVQGKLLHAVIQAGPLLETLMIAGSLPQWRNPPDLMTKRIPLVQSKDCTVVNN